MKSAHKFTVGQTIFPGSRIYPDDPEPSKISLSGPAIPVGKHSGPIHGNGRGFKEFTLSTAVAFGSFQYLSSSMPCLKTSFYPWHVKTSLLELRDYAPEGLME